MLHGTREVEVDDLLRHHKLVDLYRVVREALRTSEPGYSIKNMEKFYLPDSRQGEVKTGGESIVIYERWRRLGDPQLLQAIRSEEHTSELQSLMRISYAVFCLKKKKYKTSATRHLLNI